MPRQRLILAMAVACVAVAAVAALLLHRAAAASYPAGLEVRTPATTQCPDPLYRPVGQVTRLPAITPRNACTPSFSVQDVLDYERAHPLGSMRVNAVGHPSVTKVWFVTAREAGQLLGGDSVGLPDDALVCYVELRGTFSFAPPFAPVTQRQGTAFQIFDARTGNLLVVGGRPAS